MTSTDRTWAIRVEAKGLEPVVTGPLTRSQADALLSAYWNQDNDDAAENDGPTGRRITCEEFDPADPDLVYLIPEGEERISWFWTVFLAAACVAALLFAFHTYHLTLTAPRLRDVPIATGLAFIGTAGLFMLVGDLFTRGWDRVLARARRARQRRIAEVAS